MGARYIHMSYVGNSRGARREHDTYIYPHVGHSRGARREQDTYICPHVGHSRGTRREHDTTYIHMWGILGKQDRSKIHTYVTCGEF